MPIAKYTIHWVVILHGDLESFKIQTRSITALFANIRFVVKKTTILYENFK